VKTRVSTGLLIFRRFSPYVTRQGRVKRASQDLSFSEKRQGSDVSVDKSLIFIYIYSDFGYFMYYYFSFLRYLFIFACFILQRRRAEERAPVRLVAL
jgi:hypothetical protein